MPSRNRAFVTGAEGFIGSHLVKFLHARGWSVIGSHLSEPSEGLPRTPGIHFVQCDLRNGQRISHLLEEYQPTHIFHLGAQSLPVLSWADPVNTFESNVMGSLYIFEAVRRMKKRPIVVSACSSAEYGHVPPSAIPVKEDQPLHPLHPYGISKVCLDLLAREYFLDYGIRAVNLRLFNTTGPGKTNDAPSDFVRQLVSIKKGHQSPVIEVGNLKPHRAYLDVRDTVRAFYLAAAKGRPGQSYNICAGETHEIGKMLHSAIRLTGVRTDVRPVPRLMRPSDEKIIFGSTAKFRRDTGWKPLFALEETLGSMIEYWEAKLFSTALKSTAGV
jgi:GDP-4-dehydro-6-deoxy-D-mannose reductase